MGGVALAVITMAGTIVKLVFGMLSDERKRSIEALAIERARGDRLETSAMSAIPAVTASTIQQQQSQELIKQMGQQMLDLVRGRFGS